MLYFFCLEKMGLKDRVGGIHSSIDHTAFITLVKANRIY